MSSMTSNLRALLVTISFLFTATSSFGLTTLPIGALMGMTGSNASYGDQQSKGLLLAFEQINSTNAAGDYQLALKIEDHAGVPQKGVLAFNKLVSVDKVPFIFTSFSNIIAATAPIGTKTHTVMMNGGGTAPSLASLSPYLFSNVPLENYHIKNEATYAITKLHKRTLAILYVNDALGTGDADAMKRTWTGLGGEVVSVQSAPTDAMDFGAQLSTIKAKNPDVLYIAAGGRQVSAALNQKADLSIHSLVLGTSFWTIPELLTSSKSAAEGVIFSTQRWDPSSPSNPEAKRFVADFKAKYNSLPLGNSAAYYVAAWILADTLHSISQDHLPPTGENIRAELLKHGPYKTIFGPLTFAADGTSSMPLTLMTVRNGQFEIINQ